VSGFDEYLREHGRTSGRWLCERQSVLGSQAGMVRFWPDSDDPNFAPKKELYSEHLKKLKHVSGMMSYKDYFAFSESEEDSYVSRGQDFVDAPPGGCPFDKDGSGPQRQDSPCRLQLYRHRPERTNPDICLHKITKATHFKSKQTSGLPRSKSHNKNALRPKRRRRGKSKTELLAMESFDDGYGFLGSGG